jgi:hypothetical protein
MLSMNDDVVSRVFGDGFDDTLRSLRFCDTARDFMEFCERNFNMQIYDTKTGRGWRDFTDEEVVNSAEALVRSVRKYLVFN